MLNKLSKFKLIYGIIATVYGMKFEKSCHKYKILPYENLSNCYACPDPILYEFEWKFAGL